MHKSAFLTLSLYFYQADLTRNPFIKAIYPTAIYDFVNAKNRPHSNVLISFLQLTHFLAFLILLVVNLLVSNQCISLFTGGHFRSSCITGFFLRSIIRRDFCLGHLVSKPQGELAFQTINRTFCGYLKARHEIQIRSLQSSNALTSKPVFKNWNRKGI